MKECRNRNCHFLSEESVDMVGLICHTQLPKLWDIFTNVSLLSALDSSGYLTLDLMSSYLKDYQYELNITHNEFWHAMRYFLFRRNNKIYQLREQKRRRQDK